MRSREPIRSPGAACLIAAARNTEGSGDDASPDVWLRSPRISAEEAQLRSPSGRRTSPYKSALIRNELRASFSRTPRARGAGIAPASTPANRRPRRPVYSRPSASATVRAGISSRMRRSPFGVSNKDVSPILKPRDVHRFRSPRTGTTSIHDPRASRRGWDSRPVKTSSAIGGVIAICPRMSRRTRTFPGGLEGDQRRGVDPNAHGAAMDPGPGSLPLPPQLGQRASEEGDPFRGREIGHVPDGDPRVLGGTAQGELQIQVSCEGLLRPQAADPLPEGGPRDFGPGESHFLREFVEVLDFILVHADLEILHMTM